MRFKLISTRANKAIFTLIFFLALSQLFFIVPCYGNDPIATFEGGGDKEVLSVSYSPDGKTLASGSSDYTIKLWDVATARIRILATLEGHTGTVSSVSFSPDGKTLASGSEDNTIKLWDVATRQNRHP